MKRKAAWMVIKDEEFYVDMVLKSILDYVDGIAILDTGSRDNTLSIIREYESRYPKKIALVEENFGADYNFRFGKNYKEADARNYAMDMAISFYSPEWLVQIDSDEVYSPRFFEIIDGMEGDCLGHSTDMPTSPHTTCNNPADISNWNGIRLFDPHVRAWATNLNARWMSRVGSHVFPFVPGVGGYLGTPDRLITEEHVHFHLHRAFGPKCIGTYLCDFRQAYEGAAQELKIPLPEIFNQKYFEERFPDWFENGKFKPKKEVLAKLKNTSIPCELPDYVVKKWEAWGDWSNW